MYSIRWIGLFIVNFSLISSLKTRIDKSVNEFIVTIQWLCDDF